MAKADSSGILEALDLGFDPQGCECEGGGGPLPLVRELIPGPLLQLGLALSGQTASRRDPGAGGENITVVGSSVGLPTPLDLPPSEQDRSLGLRKTALGYESSLEAAPGSWDHYESLPGKELVKVPAFLGGSAKPKPKRIVMKSCKFHCCPADGHTTHCFMYNDHDGIAGGVVTCMFSSDRLPAGFKLKEGAMDTMHAAFDSESETGEDEEKENGEPIGSRIDTSIYGNKESGEPIGNKVILAPPLGSPGSGMAWEQKTLDKKKQLLARFGGTSVTSAQGTAEASLAIALGRDPETLDAAKAQLYTMTLELAQARVDPP